MTDHLTFAEFLAQLPSATKITLVEEWRSRSGKSKLLYPLWVAERVVVWSFLVVLAGFLCFLAWALKPLRSASAEKEVSEA